MKIKTSSQSGQVRIISGKWRGRKIPIVDVPHLRPTGDRIKETVFNWLAPYLSGAHCLDLFAGTGALAIEALSRGASSAIAVEHHRQAALCLTQLKASWEIPSLEVVQADAFTWLAQSPPHQFDIVFLDPPFDYDWAQQSCDLLEKHNCLNSPAWIYVETPRLHPFTPPAHWQCHRQHHAGNVTYSLYQRVL